jgi:hypothetical protein
MSRFSQAECAAGAARLGRGSRLTCLSTALSKAVTEAPAKHEECAESAPIRIEIMLASSRLEPFPLGIQFASPVVLM